MFDFMIRALERRGLLRKLVTPLRKLGLLNVAFRHYERYSARRTSKTAVSETKLPVPPAQLLYQVAGSADAAWFLACGEAVFGAIDELLGRQGVPLSRLKRVLDFGCGCGRVLRWWQPVSGPSIGGCDYNPAMVSWCASNLPFAHVESNELVPPLRYTDASFDFVYAISVFTHLSADLQTRWMTELKRIIAPGGWLLVTTQGSNFIDALDVDERARFTRGERVVHYDEASGSNLCNAYHPEAFVRGAWSAGFRIAEFLPAGMRPNVLQDLYLLQKN
ncbi:MAG TPA: class I SAM-dependent methyltransferase [Rudaea sp.]|jgi:SAM-dependent methyltransferase|nr:class I SAM-dependent methyltransferase [Rudaea sp.]